MWSTKTHSYRRYLHIDCHIFYLQPGVEEIDGGGETIGQDDVFAIGGAASRPLARYLPQVATNDQSPGTQQSKFPSRLN
jgi:hypothetical protein